MTITRPRFRDFCIAEQDRDNGIVVLFEGGYAVMPGKLFSRLAPVIDGRNSTEDILRLLKGEVSEPEVYYGLSQLERRGYLAETGGEVAPNVSAYWEMLRSDASESLHRLAHAKVSLRSLDETATPQLTEALSSLGIAVADGGFPVVLTSDYMRTALADINREMLQAGTPWLLAKLVGTTAWLGPLFRPGQTGCWECLAQRLRTNRRVESFLQERRESKEPFATSRGWLPTTLQVGANLAATEIAKYLAGQTNPRIEGAVLTVNTITLETERHELVRRPQCPACGDPVKHSQPVRIELQSRLKRFTADGGHRTALPEQTVERMQHHISPITGAITFLVRADTGENPVMHAYIAGHNFANVYGDLSGLRRGLRTMAGGKGASDVQARASAVAEAVERYSGAYRGDEPKRRARFHDLGDAAIDPRTIFLYSDNQYRNRHHSHGEQSLYRYVPEQFDESAEIDWTPVWSMTNQTFKYVPTAFCYYNYATTEGLSAKEVIYLSDSNGCAAGNTIEEAILQGYMEVIERDCVALFWYNRIQRPSVDLTSFDEPFFRQVQEYMDRTDRGLCVLDITNDFEIPAFCAVTWRKDRPANEPQEIVVGFGAHFDARLALMRALTECNQFLSSFERFGDSDDRYSGFEPLAVEWWKSASLANSSYLVAHPDLPAKKASDYTKLWSDDLRDDVETCVRVAKERGLEMLVLDQTRPDLGLHVAKVIIPGARHFWMRFAPGRLYDVPVQLGWLKEPLTEAEMNPYPVFF